MVTELKSSVSSTPFYPESDGQMMADNTKQFRWIVTIKENLEWLFAKNPEVFVAGDLLWYPVEGEPKIRIAPDVLIVFGRAKGDRGSYQQWQEVNIAPQVVFEILSPGNRLQEMLGKLKFYDRYGVEEYYIYDPDRNELTGLVRSESEKELEVIDPIANWTSPRLGIRFDISEEELQIERPDGERFASYVEIAQQAQQERQRADKAESLLEQERKEKEQLIQRLRDLGQYP
jgi:Uma2 family endonuclease